MKSLKFIALVGGLSLALSTAALAQVSKIGYINTKPIMEESVPAKAAGDKMKQDFSKRDKDLQDLRQQVEGALAKLERDAPTLSDTQRAARQKEYQDMGREYQRKKREFDEDLSLRRAAETQSVLDKASAVVKQIAETEKYDLILQIDGPGVIAYTNKKLDITDQVLKALNAGAK